MRTGISDITRHRAAGHDLPKASADVSAMAPLAVATDSAVLPAGGQPVTQVSWKNNVNGVWSNANNWSSGLVPGASNAVLLDTLSARTVTYASGSGTIYSLSAVTDALNITGGTLTILNAASFSNGLTLSSNSPTLTLALDGTTASVTGTFNAGGAYVLLGTATTLSVSGQAILGTSNDTYQPEIDGGALSTAGKTSVADPGNSNQEAVLGGGIVWTNTGTVNDAGAIVTGDGNGATASFVNTAGAVFDFTSDDGQILNGTVYGVPGTGSSTFSNAGTFEKTGGIGLSAVYSLFTNTGLIDVNTGATAATIAFDGGGSFGGTLTGTGGYIFSGNSTLTSGAVFNAGSLETIGNSFVVASGADVTGSYVLLNSNLTVLSGASFNPVGIGMGPGSEILSLSANLSLGANEFNQDGGDVYLNGTTLSVNAADLDFYQYQVNGTIDGPGTFVTSGTTTIAGYYGGYYTSLYLGDGLAWTNSGSVTVSSSIDIDTSYTNGFSIINDVGATINFVSGNPYNNDTVGENLAIATTFVNDGLVEMTGAYGGTTAEGIGSTFTNAATGTLSVASGMLLSLDSGGVFGGLMTGSGTLQFEGASTDFAVGADFNAATLIANSTSFTVSGGASVSAATLLINDSFQASAGSTLNVGALTIDSGTLALSTGGTFTATSLAMNGGSLTLVQNLALGAGDFSQTAGDIYLNGATLSVSGASFDFNYQVYGTIDGPGTLATSGTTTINGYSGGYYSSLILGDGLAWTNSGSVVVSSNIDIDTNYASGFSIVNQAGATFNFTSGNPYANNSVGENAAIATIFVNDGLVEMTGSAGGANAEGIGSLFTNASTGTVSAASGMVLSFDDGGVFGGLMTGAGTLQFGGNSTLTAGSVFNATSLNADGNALQISAGATLSTATLTVNGTTTLATGASIADSNLVINGNLNVSASATLHAGAVTLNSGNVDFSSGSTVSLSSLDIVNSTLTLSQNLALGAGDFTYNNGVIYLDGTTLSVNGGNFSIQYYTGSDQITGPGTLVTSGATALSDAYTYVNFLALADGVTWSNTGSVTSTTDIYDGIGGFTILNQAGATFNFEGTYQIAGYNSTSSAFTNSGTLTEAVAGDSLNVYTTFNNTSTGTINIASTAAIGLDANGSLSGTATGKGALYLQGSGLDLTGFSTSLTTAIYIDGASLALTGNSTFAGTLTDYASTVALGGYTLTMSGAKTFGVAANPGEGFEGPGTLSTTGTTSVIDGNPGYAYEELVINGGGTWSNSGTVLDAGLIQLGDVNGAGTLINTAGATFDLTTSDANIDQGTYVNSFGNTLASAATILNAGTFAKTTIGGTSSIYGTFNSTGTIATTAGYLQFDNGGSLSGLIADKSNIQLENGIGFTFGTLTIGGTAEITSGVTVDATGTLTMGDTTNTGKAIFLNQGMYEIDGNGGILAGTGAATQSFDNQTLLEKISGTGRSVVSAYVSNTGTILANSGTLALTGTVTNTGKLQIGAGATLELGSLVATTQGISFTANTGTLALDTVSGTHSTIADFTVGDEIDLVSTAANTATLTGTTLVVYENTTAVATLSLSGTHTGDTYSFLSDGHGGTLLGISANATAWKGTSNDWFSTNVWTNGAPSAQTNATVTSTGKYTLSLAASETGYVNTLQLDGTTATYAINGQLDITKSIAFQAGTLSLAGTIDGGTLTVSGGTQNYIGGTLEGVAYQGALNLTGASQSLTLENPLALTGASGSGGATINLTGAGAELFIDGVTTLASGVIDIGNASAASTLASNDADGNGGVLILGAGVTVSQTGLYAALTDSGGPYDAILNGGTIDATATDGTFTITGADFENDGTITLKNGDTLDIGSAVFVNTGTISSSSATLTLGGSFENDGSITTSFTVLNLNGTLTTAQLLAIFGGSDTVSIGGTLINTGATLNVGAGTTLGTISLSVGTIEGGTIADAGNGIALGVIGTTYGTLTGVTYEGAVNIGSVWINGSFTATGAGGTGPGSISITADNSELRFNDTQTFNNATIQIGSNGPDGTYLSVGDDTGNGATLTLGSGVTITQAGSIAYLYYYDATDEIINQGSILADAFGGTFYALSGAAATFANQGSITVSNGDVFALNGSGSFANLPGTTLTGGYYAADASSVIQLANNSTVTSLAATITLSGTGSDIESLNTNTSAEVQIDSQLSSIAAGGALNLLSGRSFSATANHGTFTDAGLLNLSGTKFTSTSLAIAGGTLSGNGTVTAAVSDAGIIAASGGTLVFNGAVTGSGGLVAGFGTAIDLTQGGTLTEAIFGAGTLKLDGTKAYMLSASSLSIGTVAVDSGVALSGNGTITGTVADAGTLSTTYGSLLIGGAVSGAGTLSAAASTVLDVVGGGSFSGVVNGAGTLRLDGATTFTLLAGGSLGAASVLVESPATLDLNAGGSLAGSISGAGTLKLDGSTPYTISGATLAIGTLLIDAGVGLSGSGTITGAIADVGNLGASGTLVLAGAVTGTGSLYAAGGAVLTLEAGGALTEQISGAGTLQFTGTTAYTLGGGTISANTVAIGTGASLSGTGTLTGSVVDSGTLTASGGLLQITGALSGTGALAAAASSVLDLTTSEGLTENVSGAGTLQLDGGTYTLAGISDSLSALLVDSSATLSGAGTISGAVTDSGTVSATGGVLVLGAISGAGVLSAAASATLDLTGGGTLASASGAGTLQLDNGTYTLAGALGFGATHVDAGATLSGFGPVSGPVVDAGTIAASGGSTLVLLGALSGAGALSAGSAAEVELSTAETLTEAISGAGSLYLAGSGTYSLAGGTIGSAALLLAGGISLSGYGSVTSAVSNSSAANPSDMLTASGGKLILSGAISGTNTALQAVAGATLDLVAGGTLSQPISGAGTLELGAAYVLGSKAPTTASLLVDAGASLSGAGSLAGTITDKGTIDATTGAIAVGTLTASTGMLLASAGEVLTLSNGGTFAGALSGAGTIQVSGTTTLSAGASLSAAHLLQKANITLGAGENASNLAGNTLTITAATGATVVFTGTSDTLTNAGSLVANGAGAEHVSLAFVNTGSAASSGTGTLTFITTVTNSGTISASGGGVAVFNASVASTGALSIGAASTLWLEAGSVAGQTATFGASTGTLDLSSPTHFLGTIDGFGGSDVIDLINTAETGFSFANGVLTVTNNTMTVASLHFGGSYTQSDFALGNDGHSGTAITFV